MADQKVDWMADQMVDSSADLMASAMGMWLVSRKVARMAGR